MATYNNIKKIKIGDNIFNLYDSGNSGGTITSVKTTAGAHTAINVTSGAANFNVPTKTSHLTNDSGFITTDYDEKVKVSALTSGTSYYPVLAAAANTASRQIDSTLQGFKYQSTAGTTSTVGTATLTLGNSTASGTANNEQGVIRIYGTTTYRNDLKALDGYPEGNYTIYLPRYKAVTYLTCTSTTNAVGGATTAPVYVDNSGCIQVVTSIPYSLLTGTPTIPTIKLNGSSSTSPSFYAPTSAGTSGQYLKSNGSSAPTWTTFPTIPTITLNGSATTSPSFYAPTSAGTSGYVLKSNGSGAPSWGSAILTDKKLEVAEVTSGGATYHPIVGTGTSASTRQYDSTGFSYSTTSGTSSTMGYANLILGNDISSGTAGNKFGEITVYGRNNKCITFQMADVATSTNCYLPNKAGTIALTSDLSSYLPLSGGTMTGPITMAHGVSNAIYGTLQNGSSALPMLTMTYGDSTVADYIALGATNNNIPIGIYGSNAYLTNGGTLTIQGNITVRGHSSYIGNVVTSDDTVSNLATGTDIAKQTAATFKDSNGKVIKLGAGSWVITATVRYTSNATGRRSVAIYIDTTSYASSYVTIPAASGTTTKVQTTLVTIQDSDFNVYIGMQQNSGSSLNGQWYLRAIRVA